MNNTEKSILSILEGKELGGLQIAKILNVDIGFLYPVFDSLEKQGLLESRYGDATPEGRGGARRRYYRLTGNGREFLASSIQVNEGNQGFIQEQGS
jgi:PadR family transcriptional regulator, regulatory protein PadR